MFGLSIKLFPLGFDLVFSVMCSGGPLLDSKGNLIGINTAIFTQTGLFYPLSLSLSWIKEVRPTYIHITLGTWINGVLLIHFLTWHNRYICWCWLRDPFINCGKDSSSADPVWQSMCLLFRSRNSILFFTKSMALQFMDEIQCTYNVINAC